MKNVFNHVLGRMDKCESKLSLSIRPDDLIRATSGIVNNDLRFMDKATMLDEAQIDRMTDSIVAVLYCFHEIPANRYTFSDLLTDLSEGYKYNYAPSRLTNVVTSNFEHGCDNVMVSQVLYVNNVIKEFTEAFWISADGMYLR